MPRLPGIRALDFDDIPACLALGSQYIWGPEVLKWQLLLTLGRGFGIDAADGSGLAAMAVLTRWGRELAAVGMVVVGKEHAGQGLGTRVMRHLLDRTGAATAFLWATQPGEPLYRKLGFRVLGRQAMHLGRLSIPAPPLPESRPIGPADLDAISALDAAAFGAPRRPLLELLVRISSRALLLEVEGRVRGFGFLWKNHDKLMLGPLVCQDPAAVPGLIAALARDAELPVRVDLPLDRDELCAWVRGAGFAHNWTAPLMALGTDALPGRREWLFTPAAQAIG